MPQGKMLTLGVRERWYLKKMKQNLAHREYECVIEIEMVCRVQKLDEGAVD